jgi:hypothetical protein
MSLLVIALLAWQTPIDEGTLVVHKDTAVIAREEFRLASVRGAAGGPGWTLASTARYRQPSLVLGPILDPRVRCRRRARSPTHPRHALPRPIHGAVPRPPH